MKTIYKIAKTELQILFYSPVAWLILVIFTFQAAMIFTGNFADLVRRNALSWPLSNLTSATFYGYGINGFFTLVQRYLYLYLPLLTMGMMSRELGSGSIKLLYSSPLTNRQIILGKYLALMIYGLVLIGILVVFALFSIATINQVDLQIILSGLLGLYLLICAYAAIGLFMSSLTSYTVVAAMGTLAILALLNYLKQVGQSIEFVRDLTYWVSISGRSDTFISGLLTSEDILYFLIVICLFILFSILKLSAGRQKSTWYVSFGKYAGVFVIAMMLGYFSALPQLKVFYDATRMKSNTLTTKSQDVMKKLKGGMTITTYTNMLETNYIWALPDMFKQDVERFDQYIRFKPDIKMKYVYYYHKADYPILEKMYPGLNAKQRLDTLNKVYNWDFPIVPYEEVAKHVDLSKEKYRFVRLLEHENGQRSFLRMYEDQQRFPSENEITAAMKRLVVKVPVVGFLTGHGERSIEDQSDRGYQMFAQERTFRYALINQGFNFAEVRLDKEIPSDIRVLVIAEVRKPLSAAEAAVLNRYIDKGGNLIIAGEPGRTAVMNPLTERIGIKFLPGMLVNKDKTKAEEETGGVSVSGGGIVVVTSSVVKPSKAAGEKPVKPVKKGQTNLLIMSPTKEGIDSSYHLAAMTRRPHVLTMPTASAMEFDPSRGFKAATWFKTDSVDSWNELETTNFVDDTVRLNPKAGEVETRYATVMALSRKVNHKEQKILVTGDADWLSNAELGMGRNGVLASNFSLINGAFFWLTDGEVPQDMRRAPAPDTSLSIGKTAWAIANILLSWIFPLLLMLAGLVIWIRRRGR